MLEVVSFAINPIMGLGMALMEETQLDWRNDRIMNPNLAQYRVPTHLDVPEIEVAWIDVPDPHSPIGAHGVGELGITGTAAAVANAIYDATGKRVRDLPINLDKLCERRFGEPHSDCYVVSLKPMSDLGNAVAKRI